ncbi:DUF4249 domain-containing protein [Dyadobacter tibetensis]|uniref:DUF4249 domain-containing protein n=1 Tax=Dyadobacter tibetensis TaxID=1211851 RepID=UPI0004B20154|nr:DUF4249 domain-containing protein [Dyadobacter tibetensis]
MTKYIGIIVLLFSFNSCIEEIDGLSNTPEELVLHCYISPSDTLISAVLSRATSFAMNEIKFNDLFVKDAHITMSDGNLEKQLVLNPKNNFYEFKVSNDFKIEKGKTYSIKAVAKDGKVLTSSCTVPLKSIKQEEIEVEKSFRGSDFVDIRLKWPSNRTSFYVLRPYFYYSGIRSKNLPTSHTIQFFSGADIESDKITSNYFTNDLINNQRRNIVFLYVADENFYTYSKSTELNSNNQDDPFAQPVNAKHNINGGFGCFGAYYTIRLDLDF